MSIHQQALEDRMAVVLSIINETHPPPPEIGPISRESRGLAIVLLFAAYEELLTSLTRTLLETAVKLKISNSRLQPGFRAFAISSSATSLRNVSEKKLFASAIPDIIDTLGRTDRSPSINTSDFPNDGSFMKQSQISVWARTFQIGPPAPVLSKIWNNIDAVVTQRNEIAHGKSTPQEVGRRYTEHEIRDLITNWHMAWSNFLIHVESCASTRDFFRLPR